MANPAISPSDADVTCTPRPDRPLLPDFHLRRPSFRVLSRTRICQECEFACLLRDAVHWFRRNLVSSICRSRPVFKVDLLERGIVKLFAGLFGDLSEDVVEVVMCVLENHSVDAGQGCEERPPSSQARRALPCYPTQSLPWAGDPRRWPAGRRRHRLFLPAHYQPRVAIV